MTFLNFEQVGRSPSGKTRRINVANRGGATLGNVEWYAPWRRYCFAPTGPAVFDAACLHDIADHLTAYTQEQQAGAAALREARRDGSA